MSSRKNSIGGLYLPPVVMHVNVWLKGILNLSKK